MNEPHLDPALHHPVQHLQKRHHLRPARHSAYASAIPSLRSALITFGGYSIDIHILDVCSGSCDRYAAHSLRSFGQPDRLRRQANVAIHNLSLACGTMPQTTEV